MTDYPDIVLIGYAGAGKSTAAQFLTEHLGYNRFAYAGVAEHPHPGSVRDLVTTLWGYSAINDREKLIHVGNSMREIDEDVWIPPMELALMGDDTRPRIVDDCRFPNELAFLQGRGFVTVRVLAPRWLREERLKANGKWIGPEYLDSPIEHHLDDEPFDHQLLNDGTHSELYEQILNMLNRERAKR